MKLDWDVELDEAHEEALLDDDKGIEELMGERDAL
jgi:hypothetical protein